MRYYHFYRGTVVSGQPVVTVRASSLDEAESIATSLGHNPAELAMYIRFPAKENA